MSKLHIVSALVIAVSTLCSTVSVAQEKHSYQFNEVDGNKIAWSCTGTGNPHIVLISGSGLTAHNSFGRVFHGYDGPGRICMYDRAGIGESTFTTPQIRTLDQMVEEMRTLVVTNDWHEAVLVPHSFGGFIARAYARKYPTDVRAILFLDVVHEDWLPKVKAKMIAGDWSIMEQVLAWNTSAFHEDYLQAQEAVRSFKLQKDLPITVVSRGIPNANIRLQRMSYEGIDTLEREHARLQLKIAGLSSNSRRVVARYSSHIFNDYDPWIVIDELKLLIERMPHENKAR